MQQSRRSQPGLVFFFVALTLRIHHDCPVLEILGPTCDLSTKGAGEGENQQIGRNGIVDYKVFNQIYLCRTELQAQTHLQMISFS